jgi:hypothetical protein
MSPRTATVEDAVASIRRILDGSRLIWFGIRGEDGEALLQLDELGASFSIIAPMRSGSLGDELNVSLEGLRRRRPDLDRFDIDLDPDSDGMVGEFRRLLLRAVSERCVMMTYRPSSLVSALAFSMGHSMTLAGLFKDRQSAFEHKPWVERSLEATGVLGLGWHYVADEHRGRAKRLLASGPHVLRASRTSGGVGIAHVTNERELDENWPEQADAFVAVAPFLDPASPVNFSGCVFSDGTIRLHPPSIQLIGVGSCTSRRFGYCGNDFAAASLLSADVLDQIQRLGETVGRWLHSERYLGVFGVDALIHEERVHFTEINARFQGSSALSAELAGQLDVPDLFLDHLAATLGARAIGRGLSIREWATEQSAVSQIVLHNTTDAPLCKESGRPLAERRPGLRLAQQAPDFPVDPGAALCRLTVPRQVTSDGFSIDADAESLVDEIRSAFSTIAITDRAA